MVSIGVIEIRYYSLAYIIGAIIVYAILLKLVKERELKLTKNEVMDYISYCLLGLVIGARLGYVLFYNFSYYLSHPLEILMVWKGGMSFHGGLILGIAMAYIFARKKKINFWQLADISVIPLGLALCLGRIGNFINGELYGRITSVPWAVKFKGVEGFRHPSQLYEAIKNLIIFGILWSIRKRRMPQGFVFWLFITMYGAFRFLIEFTREPDANIGFFLGLTLGQYLCIIMIALGSIMMLRLKKQSFYKAK